MGEEAHDKGSFIEQWKAHRNLRAFLGIQITKTFVINGTQILHDLGLTRHIR